MGILGFAEGAERGINGAGATIHANAMAIQGRMNAAHVSDARADAAVHAYRAAGAAADFNHVVSLLAASTAENARLRAALDDADDENAHLSLVISRMRAQ